MHMMFLNAVIARWSC